MYHFYIYYCIHANILHIHEKHYGHFDYILFDLDHIHVLLSFTSISQ